MFFFVCAHDYEMVLNKLACKVVALEDVARVYPAAVSLAEQERTIEKYRLLTRDGPIQVQTNTCMHA